jgi:hypothetical protein
MSTWVTAWFVIGLISATAVVVCVVGLAKHLMVLNRTLKVFQEEEIGSAAEIAAGGARASFTAANLKPSTGSRR